MRRNSLEVREAFLRAAEATFAERGFSGTTSRELAKVAGVSESVLYRHFGSKSGLFAEAVLAPFLGFMETFTATSTRHMQQPLDTEFMMRLFVSDLVEHLSAHRGVLRAFLAASDQLDEEVIERFHSGFEAVVSQLATVIGAEQEMRGRTKTPLGASMDIRAAFGMILSLVVLDDLLMPAARPTKQELADHLSQFLLAEDRHA
jgi:AcrR family transcriptional regulator